MPGLSKWFPDLNREKDDDIEEGGRGEGNAGEETEQAEWGYPVVIQRN